MTDRQLRGLGKNELLALLRDQESEIVQLNARIEELERQQQDRVIQAQQCGSIAQAAMKLNGVFEAAQQAADDYLASVRAGSVPTKSGAAPNDDTLLRCKLQCIKMESDAQKRSQLYWQELTSRLDHYYDAHPGLQQELLKDGIRIRIPHTAGAD